MGILEKQAIWKRKFYYKCGSYPYSLTVQHVLRHITLLVIFVFVIEDIINIEFGKTP